MNILELETQLQAAQWRLLHLQGSNPSESISLEETQEQLIAELSEALAELHVAVEELHLRNSTLVATHEALNVERQRYQALFKFAPDGYLVTNSGGTIQEANRRAETLLNVRCDRLVGKPFFLFIAEGNRPAFSLQLARLAQLSVTQRAATALQPGEDSLNIERITYPVLQNWEVSLQPRDGELFPAAISVSAEYTRYGKLVQLLWLIRDLSDRQQAEQKIQEQATLIEITSDAILVRDLEARIVFWNPGAERIYGWTAEEAVGKTDSELLAQETPPPLKEAWESAIAKGKWQGELPQVTKFGREIIVASRWTLMRDKVGNPKSILTVDTDITEKKQLQAQFFHAQRLDSLGTLASGIAHDLNNILTPIFAGTQLLQHKFKDADDRTQQILKMQEKQIQRAGKLVKQVLSFSRDSRGIEGERTVLQVSHLFKEVRQIVTQTFPKWIDMDVYIRPYLWNLRGDATQLHQVLLNLCLNALDAMPDGGTLRLSAKNLHVDKTIVCRHPEACVGSYIVITVSDTGCGIPPEIGDRIFDPFFTTKEVGQGTGLGLAIAASIIKSHGGFIEVISEVNKGTQVKVFLPALEGAEAVIEEKSELCRGQGELILVVDDEATICTTTQTVLETYNYCVLTAHNGVDAIALYSQHQHKIQAVLMDMMMPSMSGLMAIQSLCELNPNVKIIATSGLTSGKLLAITEKLCVKAFLSKPYPLDKLLKTLHKVLGSTE